MCAVILTNPMTQHWVKETAPSPCCTVLYMNFKLDKGGYSWRRCLLPGSHWESSGLCCEWWVKSGYITSSSDRDFCSSPAVSHLPPFEQQIAGRCRVTQDVQSRHVPSRPSWDLQRGNVSFLSALGECHVEPSWEPSRNQLNRTHRQASAQGG